MAFKHRITGLMFCYIFLAGCTTVMKGAIDSVPDPTYGFEKETHILVTVADNSNNSLRSRYFVPRVSEALSNRGFNNIYTGTNKDAANEPFGAVVLVGVGTVVSSYKYSGPDYGKIQTGAITNCDKSSSGGSLSCTTTETMSTGVVGYSEKTGYTVMRFFTLKWYDVETKRIVMSVAAGSFDSECSEEKVYEFLADQALLRMNFKKIVKQDFVVEMPKEYRCQ